MRSKQLLSAALLASISLSLFQLVKAQGALPTSSYTLQVAAYPEAEKESADRLMDDLSRAGELVAWGTVELRGRGKWIRVFVGSFGSNSQARRYGENLQSRAVIKDFFVRTRDEINSPSRPRSIARQKRYTLKYAVRPIIASGLAKAAAEADDARLKASSPLADASVEDDKAENLYLPEAAARAAAIESESLPVIEEAKLAEVAPSFDAALVPRDDPVELAFRSIVADARARKRGGLWITGDRAEALARLEWILGIEKADVFSVAGDGRLQLNTALLAEAAGISEVSPGSAPLVMLDYILSNEGLLLLVQLTEGAHRYRLHIGRKAPTFGGQVTVAGGLNLDNNFDSRINPYRRFGVKLDQERPPGGFDSMVAINPVARWYNLRATRFVPDGHIIFHELAEAYAKLELGLDYLGQGGRVGAHNVALERERRLKSQRPDLVVVTTGPNRVLRSEEEIRQFYAEGGSASGHQR
jgi:hypothetical protein